MQKLGLEIGLPADHVFFTFIASQKSSMTSVFVVTSLFVAIYLFVFGLLYSHRIAGPIYRLQQDLKGFTAGKPLRRIKFRKGDYFQELANAVNDQVCPETKSQSDEDQIKSQSRAS